VKAEAHGGKLAQELAIRTLVVPETKTLAQLCHTRVRVEALKAGEAPQELDRATRLFLVEGRELMPHHIGERVLHLQLLNRREIGKKTTRPFHKLGVETIEKPGIAIVLLAIRRKAMAEVPLDKGMDREDKDAGIGAFEASEPGEGALDIAREGIAFLIEHDCNLLNLRGSIIPFAVKQGKKQPRNDTECP
jgi:hypothetical protein